MLGTKSPLRFNDNPWGRDISLPHGWSCTEQDRGLIKKSGIIIKHAKSGFL